MNPGVPPLQPALLVSHIDSLPDFCFSGSLYSGEASPNTADSGEWECFKKIMIGQRLSESRLGPRRGL